MNHSILKAGVAEVDITPPPGLFLWGYAARTAPSQGTLDPLFARVLVLSAGGKRLALVALDLGRSFGPASLERLCSAVKDSSGISCVLTVASHTHSGPVIQDEYSSVPEWEKATLQKIANAIDEAHRNSQAVRLGIGYGVAYIGHNRRRVDENGKIVWLDRNMTRIPTSPVDPRVSVLRIDFRDGTPLAILVNYACHPVVFGPDNLKYSADFPGAATRVVRESFGGTPMCFFLQGAAGDINPYHAATPLAEDAVKMCDWTGTELGREAARVAHAIRTEASEPASLDLAESQINFGLRWQPEAFRKALFNFGPQFFECFAPRIMREWQLPVTTVLINKRIALIGVPGEAFVEFQINWLDRCPVRDCFFLGYANGYFGYFPSIRAAAEGGYGASSATTWVEVGAGERMVNEAVVKLYEMLGRLGDVPQTTAY